MNGFPYAVFLALSCAAFSASPDYIVLRGAKIGRCPSSNCPGLDPFSCKSDEKHEHALRAWWG